MSAKQKRRARRRHEKGEAMQNRTTTTKLRLWAAETAGSGAAGVSALFWHRPAVFLVVYLSSSRPNFGEWIGRVSGTHIFGLAFPFLKCVGCETFLITFCEDIYNYEKHIYKSSSSSTSHPSRYTGFWASSIPTWVTWTSWQLLGKRLAVRHQSSCLSER